MVGDAIFDAIVVGGGPAGLAAAGCLARLDIKVALASAGHSPDPAARLGTAGSLPETRTAALFPPAIALLDGLGAWDELRPLSAPLRAIRIIDGTGRLLRAPEVLFTATDLGLDTLAWNVPNAALADTLRGAARRLGVEMIEGGRAGTVDCLPGRAVVALADGRLSATLVVGADGRDSLCRAAAGISARAWGYAQTAIAASLTHGRPHHGISTEIHGPAGPCTTVPLPGNASSLVWMERADEAARLMALDDASFTRALETRLGGLLGEIEALGPRRAFPLTGLIAATMAQHRIALVGEAGHAMPPIGAQGLNLGLTDAAVLADCVADARAAGRDIGGADVTARYANARSADVRRRVGAVDLLNRSLEPAFLPLGLLRGAGLHALAASSTLRRRLMREGLYPPAPTPRAMQQTA